MLKKDLFICCLIAFNRCVMAECLRKQEPTSDGQCKSQLCHLVDFSCGVSPASLNLTFLICKMGIWIEPGSRVVHTTRCSQFLQSCGDARFYPQCSGNSPSIWRKWRCFQKPLTHLCCWRFFLNLWCSLPCLPSPPHHHHHSLPSLTFSPFSVSPKFMRLPPTWKSHLLPILLFELILINSPSPLTPLIPYLHSWTLLLEEIISVSIKSIVLLT